MSTALTRRLRLSRFFIIWLLGLLLAVPAPLQAQAEPGAVHILEISGIINPPVVNYLTNALQDAAEQGARLVIIQIDTPGGLVSSTRVMTQAILASPVPVVVYVSPPGAHAASAGLFILQSAHLAAMAPSTNTGSAHPVGMGGEADEIMASKVVHDAAATIRTLAEHRGRNAAWAEQAVRESVSVTEQEALQLQVIEFVARDLDDLLQQIQGWTVVTTAGEIILDVAQAPLHDASMNFAQQLLHIISSPDIAFILLSVGSIGLIAELYNPGTLIPGITGVISLIFAFFALGNLPTNWAGVALIVLAIVLLVAELNTDATGILSAGAIIGFLLGGLILFRPFTPAAPELPLTGLTVNPWLVGGSTALLMGFMVLILSQVARTRHQPLHTGAEQFIGQLATVHQALTPEGRVRFEGQLWFARVEPEQQVPPGQEVCITAVEGLTLVVEPLAKSATPEMPSSVQKS